MRVARTWYVLLMPAVCAWSFACGGKSSSTAESTAAKSGGATAPASAVPHGDHTARHGGLVLMNGDMHFEVVLHRSGQYRVFFSDAVRNEMPASAASDVKVAIKRLGQPEEQVPLEIDDRDESWTARGRPVPEAESLARISYSFRGQPYWIDLPIEMPAAAVPNPHATQTP